MQAKHYILSRAVTASVCILACGGVLFASGMEFGFVPLIAQHDMQDAINEGASGRADWAWLVATLAFLGVVVAGIIARMVHKIEKDRGAREDMRMAAHKESIGELTNKFIESTKTARDDFRSMLADERMEHRTQRSEDRDLFERHHKENADRLDSAIMRQTNAMVAAIQKRSGEHVV